jgi:hypothetical protein
MIENIRTGIEKKILFIAQRSIKEDGGLFNDCRPSKECL